MPKNAILSAVSLPKIKKAARHPPVFFRSNNSFPCISTGAYPMLNLSTSNVSKDNGVRFWSCTEGCSMNISGDAILSEHPPGIDKKGEFIDAILFKSLAAGDNGIVAVGDDTGIHCSACCSWTGDLWLWSSAVSACPVSLPIESTRHPGLVNHFFWWKESPPQVPSGAKAWFFLLTMGHASFQI